MYVGQAFHLESFTNDNIWLLIQLIQTEARSWTDSWLCGLWKSKAAASNLLKTWTLTCTNIIPDIKTSYSHLRWRLFFFSFIFLLKNLSFGWRARHIPTSVRVCSRWSFVFDSRPTFLLRTWSCNNGHNSSAFEMFVLLSEVNLIARHILFCHQKFSNKSFEFTSNGVQSHMPLRATRNLRGYLSL